MAMLLRYLCGKRAPKPVSEKFLHTKNVWKAAGSRIYRILPEFPAGPLGQMAGTQAAAQKLHPWSATPLERTLASQMFGSTLLLLQDSLSERGKRLRWGLGWGADGPGGPQGLLLHDARFESIGG